MSQRHFVFPILLTFAAGAAALAPTGQGQELSLLFTTKSPQQTLSGSSGTSLGQITNEDVAVVRPLPFAAYSAETYACLMNWNTQFGDEDGDGVYFENPLSNSIDALLVCRYGNPTPPNPTMRELFFSPRGTIGFSCGTVVRAGDVAATRPNGTVQYFMTENMFESAFGLPIVSFTNVDAVTWDGTTGTIFVSFEDSHVLSAGPLSDGGIAVILGADLFYDGCKVVDVNANAGFILLTETQVDQFVAG